MKFIYNISLVFILVCCYQSSFSTTRDSCQIISVTLDIIALDESLHLKFPNAKMEEYFIVITLTNIQDTTVHFITMTCSWRESFIFDKDSLYLSDVGCDSNFPTAIDILPHKTVKFFGKLRSYKKKRDYYNAPTFKIGFVDLPYNYFLDFTNTKKEKKKHKTYWSDNIYLRSRIYQYEVEKAN